MPLPEQVASRNPAQSAVRVLRPQNGKINFRNLKISESQGKPPKIETIILLTYVRF
jgi:hypothetical protein